MGSCIVSREEWLNGEGFRGRCRIPGRPQWELVRREVRAIPGAESGRAAPRPAFGGWLRGIARKQHPDPFGSTQSDTAGRPEPSVGPAGRDRLPQAGLHVSAARAGLQVPLEQSAAGRRQVAVQVSR
jgi:hypothetical protein